MIHYYKVYKVVRSSIYIINQDIIKEMCKKCLKYDNIIIYSVYVYVYDMVILYIIVNVLHSYIYIYIIIINMKYSKYKQRQ